MRRTFGMPMVIVVICATVLLSRSNAQSTLVISYALDEGSGAIASDASGSNANGTLVDAPTWTSPGRLGGGLMLDGTSQYVQTDSPNLPTGDFTWALWIKRQSNPSFQTLMEAQGTTAAELEVNLLDGALSVWTSGSQQLLTTSVVPENTWTHVAVTRDGDTLRAYINGGSDGQTGTDSRVLDFAACPLLIGVDADSGCTGLLNGYLQAEIDEVQIHSRALTAAEIQQLMDAPLGGSVPDTTAPVRSTSQPNITAPAGTTQLSIALTTNELATCRYELTPDVAYASMSGLLSSTGTTTHTLIASGLSDGSTRTYHIRCQDTAANANADDFLITVTVAPPGPPPPPPQATFYVAPGGDDQDPGTLEQPFQTIEGARQAVRGVNGSMSGDIQVVLRGGEYNLTSTVTFGQPDSGTNGHDVIYAAYPGERPVVHGGQHVTGWTPAGGGIYKAQVGPLRFRQLYVNGTRAVRARTPNAGAYDHVVFWDTVNRRVQVGNGEVGTWQRQNQVEMIILGKGVNQSNLRIASVGGSVVTPLEPERTRLFQQSYPPKDPGRPYYFENALEFLDTPGEWYLNTDTNEVHYMPRPGEDLATADVVVPRLERLLAVSGTLAAPVRNIQFRNLTFAYSTWLVPDTEGFVGDQASVVFTQPLPADQISSYPGHRHPAAVHVEAADDIAFERNVFSHLGSSGLNLYESTHDNRVVGNVFTDISASGISVGLDLLGNPPDARQVSRGAVIQNNYLSETGVEFYQSVGIMVGYGDSVVIEHNELSKMPYSGITVGWGWANEDNAARNNLVRYNEIQDVLKTMSDGGGIYTLSLQPGTFISDNYVHDIVRTGLQGGFNISGIYLDEGSGHITVRDNVLQSTGDTGIFQNANGPNNSFSNNAGQSPATMAAAGLESAYEDIRPGSTPSVLTFSASPLTIAPGQSSTLTWTTTNATTVSIDQGIGSVATSGTLSVSPAATTTYTITGTNGSSSATATATVTVVPLPTITFSASPLTIAPGQSSTLTWSTTGATSVSINQGIGSVATSGNLGVSPAATTIYTLTATNDGGSATATATVTVVPLPTITFSASPLTIAPGQSSTLTWSTTGATSVSINQGIGSVAASGTQSVSPAATTIYTLTATNDGGSATATATVTVVPLPTITFSASPLTIAPGQSSTLTWSTTGATSVSINQGIGSVATSGNLGVSPAATTIYTLTATNDGGSATATATVTVVPLPTITFSASPLTIAPGQSSTLTWSTTGATSVSINQGIGSVATSGNLGVSPAATTIYTLTATNDGGSATATATVTVVPLPTITFSASPLTIAAGQSSTLTWSTTGATSVSINQGIGSVATSGNLGVSPAATTIYTLTATNDGGSATATATVTITSLPTITFSASPLAIAPGQSSILTWSTTNATSVRINAGIGIVATSDTRSVSPNVTTTYTLTATNAIGSTTATATVTVDEVPAPVCRAVGGDFDNDHRSDVTVFRPGTGGWFNLHSTTGYATYSLTMWGMAGDIPVPGDYDCDGKLDLAVYRPSTSQWYVLKSSSNNTAFVMYQWGANGDVPVPGDYDGDGMSDLALYRPSAGQWLVLKSSSDFQTGETYNWGAANTDVPVGGDYDGDGKHDLAVYRPSSSTWWIMQSSTGFTTFLQWTWGLSSDPTVPGDYDGDGKTDPAVFRASSRTWYILKSSTNYTTYWTHVWGLSTDTLVPADYDGDGRIDLAVFRPSTGEWYILQSTTNYTTYVMHRWGASADIPINKQP